MKVLFKKLKKSNKVALSFFIVAFLAYIVLYGFLIKNLLSLKSIETAIRIAVMVFLGIWFIAYTLVSLVKLIIKKYKLFIVLTVFTYLFIGVMGVGNYIFAFAFDKLDRFTEKDTVLYTSVLITLKDTEFNDDSVIGMVTDTEDIEGNILAKKIIKEHKLKNEIKDFDDYYPMLDALYNKEIDAIFVSDNYITIFGSEEDYNNIATDTKVIYKLSEKRKNKDKKIKSNKKLDEPFTVLIMGVDSETNGLNANAAFNGDTLIMATINPKTLTASMFSVPRDTYVPIACRNNAYAKINSSAAYGTSCVIDTMQNLTGIKIDYYVKINFKGVVDLVEALGGITVDVQKPDFEYNHGFSCEGRVCEQDSNRDWSHAVFMDYGRTTLNGEQALAYSRCRGLYIESDIARNRHQQDVITAIANKVLKVRSFEQFEKVLDAVSNNVATNMTRDQILSSYDILKNMLENSLNGEEMIQIKKTYLEVTSLPVNLGSRITSALTYYPGSLEEISQMMKENLELVQAKEIKSFKYNANEDYEAKVFGKGIRTGAILQLMPNLIGSTVADAQAWGSKNNITVDFTYDDQNSTIISNQNVPIGTLLMNVRAVTFTVGSAPTKTTDDEEEKTDNTETEEISETPTEEETQTEEETENTEE